MLPNANLFAVLNLDPAELENLDDGDVGAKVVDGSGLLKDVLMFGRSVTISRREGRRGLSVISASLFDEIG